MQMSLWRFMYLCLMGANFTFSEMLLYINFKCLVRFKQINRLYLSQSIELIKSARSLSTKCLSPEDHQVAFTCWFHFHSAHSHPACLSLVAFLLLQSRLFQNAPLPTSCPFMNRHCKAQHLQRGRHMINNDSLLCIFKSV